MNFSENKIIFNINNEFYFTYSFILLFLTQIQ